MDEQADDITWARKEIVTTSPELKSSCAQLDRDINTCRAGKRKTYPPLESPFVLCDRCPPRSADAHAQ